MHYVIGFDQSYTSSGYSVLDESGEMVDFGTIKTKDGVHGDIFDRANVVTDALVALCKKHNATVVTLEGLAFGKFGNATRDLAGLQFVIISNFRKQLPSVTLNIVSPNLLKKFATGNGKAKKPEMVEFLPELVLSQFIDSKLKKSTGLYDATDAYWLSKYALIELTKITKTE